MSTTKKISSISNEYSELREQFIHNCQESLENLTALNNICVTVFNNTNSVDDITYIKEEWIKSSNKIDTLKDSIQTLQTEKNTIIKKIETIINKKTKTTGIDAKNITACQEEWCQVSSQMTILNEQLESFNKDRATIIKKAETYFSKIDSTKTKKPNKKNSTKASNKDTEVDVDEEVTIMPKKSLTKKETLKKELADKKKVATKINVVDKKAVDKKVTAAEKKAAATEKKTAVADKKTAVADKKTTAAEKKAATASKKAINEVVVISTQDTKAKTKIEPMQNKLQLDSDSDSDTDSDSESDTDSNLSSVDSGSDSDSDSSDDENDKE